MSSLPPQDPLVALWQTAPKPDTRQLLQDLQRQRRLHQRLNQTVWAIVGGIDILLIFEEATGRVPSRGILSVIWTLGLVIGLVCQRRSRCKRCDALALDTVSLLKSMIAQAKNDLFLARCLYAGVPCGGIAGYVVTRFAGISASSPARGISPHLRAIQVGAGIVAFIIMIVAGAILARSRRLQVQQLSEKLMSITDDL
jgi:hypothetical protein